MHYSTDDCIPLLHSLLHIFPEAIDLSSAAWKKLTRTTAFRHFLILLNQAQGMNHR